MAGPISYFTGGDSKPSITRREWDKEIAGRLKTGDHKLNDREFSLVEQLVDAHMDSERYGERGSVNRKEAGKIISSLRKNREHQGMSEKQIAHVEKSLLAQL